MSYDWRVRPRNCRLLFPKTLLVLGGQLPRLLFYCLGFVTYNQATPGLLNAWNSESRNSTIVSFNLLGLEDHYSATEGAVVHLDTFWTPET